MKCNKCHCVLDEQMNFCPICGNQVGKAVDITNLYENKKTIEKLYSDKEYDQILNFAMMGDNIAKCYYIEYICEESTNAIKSIAQYQGISVDVIDELLQDGLSPEEVEEYIYEYAY